MPAKESWKGILVLLSKKERKKERRKEGMWEGRKR
jgi:hypothetical protein